VKANPTYTEAVAHAVAAALDAAGVSAERLDHETGLSSTTIRRKLNLLAPFNTRDLEVIARHLQIDIEQLSSPRRAVA
jgi:lambda repressor-like predicted transcriptional regulator